MTETELYAEAMRQYGYDAQLCKLAEEASELSAEACRALNHCTLERRLAGEIADVEILIAQFRQTGMVALIDARKAEKLQRLADRLGVAYAAEH
ncbi:hypothetical protein ACIF2R_01560 [Serratia marcescens]|uniref:hypothetical protein n=1 Tax=Serratia marcescens TaxID=615 RepID=UPI0037D6106E